MAVTFTPTTVNNPIGAQGSYPQRQVAGHEGMIADLQAYVCRSYRNQSGAAIPYGVLVQTDNSPTSNDPLAIQPATSGSLIQGLVISSMVVEGSDAGMVYTPVPTPFAADGRMGYPDKETVNVVSKGVVWVYTTAAIALGDAVRFFNADHSGTVTGAFLGRFTKTAVANKTVAISAGARWLSETSGAGLVLLEVDIPAMTYTADTGT
jgi:hypothetical protein